jgi:tripartite-type tricarboxylate transporter receptor subunit TctC
MALGNTLPELFKMMTSTQMSHITYRGAQPAYQDVISGRVPVFFDNMSTAISLTKSGNIRALAISSKKRSALMPELPTVDESGVPGYEYHTLFGIGPPKGTPQPVIDTLHTEVKKAPSNPIINHRIAATTGEPSDMALKDPDPFVKAEIAKWAEVVKRAGIKVE